MAKMIFEIFDIEMINELERADIEAMYRFMYDCDDHDEFYVAQVPYDNEGNISKQEFASGYPANSTPRVPMLAA